MEWKDVTSYRKNERGKIAPRSLELSFDNKRMVICKHVNYEGEFIIRGFEGFNFDYIRTYTEDLEEAKKYAIEFLNNELTKDTKH